MRKYVCIRNLFKWFENSSLKAIHCVLTEFLSRGSTTRVMGTIERYKDCGDFSFSLNETFLETSDKTQDNIPKKNYELSTSMRKTQRISNKDVLDD